MPRVKKQEEFQDEINEVDYNPEDQLTDFMKKNKTGHFNDAPDYDYVTSTGSLNLDIHMGGGFRSGIIRFTGMSGGGKSAESQTVVGEFFKLHEKARAVIIPSEGKRVENLARFQKKFKCTSKAQEWENHSCFIFRTNIYEKVISLIRHLIENNPTDTRYIFIIDSVDALNLESDWSKDASEATKVAGGALMSSVFLKQMSLMISSLGHLVILINQVRGTIELNKYKREEKRLSNSGGGKALEHYADWIMEFGDQLTYGDKIWDGDPGKSKIIGHYCEITFRKTPNNTTGTTVRYPIKYNPDRTGSIWDAYEIADTLLMWEQVTTKQAWVYLSDNLVNELNEAGFKDIPNKINGLNKFRKFFEDNPEITQYLKEKFKKLIIQQ